MREETILAAAIAAHEVNRVYCAALGDFSQRCWEEAPEWQRRSAKNGVRAALAGVGPAAQHAAWCEEKIAEGWVWGREKDAEKKLHPCLVPYDELPAEQRKKDDLYGAVVRAVIAALGAA